MLKYTTAADPAFADNYEVEGDLAESVEIPADGLTVTFKMRPNVTWQNIAPVSGRAVDAEDVKFSLERFRTDPKSTNRAVFGTAQNPLVQSVETPDPRTVVFKLAKPYGPFRNLIANSNYLWILPKEIGAGTADPGKQMIGAGPFTLESTQPDIAYKVAKNPTYYGNPMPYVDGVNLAIITEETQEVAQFQAGRLDVAGIPAERVEEVQRSVPKAELIEYLPQTFALLAFQLRGDPHDYLYNMHHTRSARNHGGVNDPQLDAMIDKEEAALDDNERIKLVKEIQRYCADKVYYGTTAVGPAFIGVQDWIKNYQRNNGYGAGVENRAKLWIDRG